MKFGWCGKNESKGSHARCKFQFVPNMGVHKDHLMVCDCECHKDREPDFTGLPEGTVIATAENKILPHEK